MGGWGWDLRWASFYWPWWYRLRSEDLDVDLDLMSGNLPYV